MKRLLTNVLLFHKDSEILKLLFNNIDYYKSVSRIIYSECKDYQDELVEKRNKINYMSLSETLKIVKDFLKDIKPEYPILLEELMNNGVVNIYDITDEKKLKEYGDEAYYARHNGNHTINIPLYHDINDAFIIVHEFMHYIVYLNGVSVDGFLFTEAISISHEMLFYDYLKQNKLYEEYLSSPIALRLLSIKDKSNAMLNVIKEYESERSKSFMLTTLEESSEKASKNFYDLSAIIIYLTGETLAIQIYYYYKLGLITIEDLQELIRLINNNEHLESLNLIFKSIPATEDIRESIIYIRNELLKKCEKTIKLQK